ncbi:MAG: flagellar protein FlgN [Candidatus Saccharibacteria bacterium]
MRETINDLLQNLETENLVVEQILDLAQKKRQVIISGDIKELDMIIRKENSMYQSLNKAEASRFKTQVELARLFGTTIDSLTASDIVQRVRPIYSDCADQIRDKADVLTNNLDQLAYINHLNKDMINQSLAFLETMETLLIMAGDTTYSSQGTVGEVVSRPGILDRKV